MAISKNGLILTDSNLSPDFILSVSMGMVEGASLVNKFGQNLLLTSGAVQDVWDNGGEYTYPPDSTAPITHLVSTSASDIMDIEVQGLNAAGELVIQTITITGTTLKPLDTNLWRVFRLVNVGSSDNVGDITATDGSTAVYAKIQVGNNQTLMALYTIPDGHTGFLYQMGVSMVGSTKDYHIAGEMRMRPYGGVYQLKTTFGIVGVGTSVMQRHQPLYGKILEKTDVRVLATEIGAVGSAGINATFDILLLDNAVWDL